MHRTNFKLFCLLSTPAKFSAVFLSLFLAKRAMWGKKGSEASFLKNMQCLR